MSALRPAPPSQQALTALGRHWGKMFLAMLAVMGGVCGLLLLLPPLYTSEAKLFVRLGRESVGLDPTATNGQTVSTIAVQETREAEINSVCELVVSREVLGALVDEFGPEAILGKPTADATKREARPEPLAAAGTSSDANRDSASLAAAPVASFPVAAPASATAPVDPAITVPAKADLPPAEPAEPDAGAAKADEGIAKADASVTKAEPAEAQSSPSDAQLGQADAKLAPADPEVAPADAQLGSADAKAGPADSKVEPFAVTEPAAAPPSIWLRINPLAEYDPRDEAIRRLSKRVQVEVARRSNIVNVTCDAPTPELAQRICERLLAKVREVHLRVNRTAGSLDFFVEQTQRQADRVAALDDELRRLKNRTGVASVDTQRDLLVKQIASLEENRIKATAAFTAAEAEIRLRRETLDTLPTMHVTAETRGHAQTAASRLREQLYALELREKELVSKFQEDTVFVQQVRDQIAQARKVLSAETDPVERTTSLNLMRQQSQQSLIEATARSAGLRAEVVAWESLGRDVRRVLEDFNRDEIELATLDRQLALEVDTLRKFSENREVARIDQALRDQSISNLNVLQAPTFSRTPTKPKTTLYLSLGLVLAFVSAMVVGAAADWRERLPLGVDDDFPPRDEWSSSGDKRHGRGDKGDEPWDDDSTHDGSKGRTRHIAH